jgi:hypothetical protein
MKKPKEVIRDVNHRRTDNTWATCLKKPKGVIKDRQSQAERKHKSQQFEETKRGNQRPSITEGQTTQGQKFVDVKRDNQRPSIPEGQKTQGPKV